jgi:flagellar biosynthesis/type III secretory pathway protein FliH
MCTAPAECCTGGTGAACGACIAAKMHAELQDAPPPPSQEAVQAKTEGKAEGEAKGKAEGKAEGKTEGALMGSGITLACIAAAQLLWSGAQRRRTQRETRSLEIGAPAQAL